MYYVNHERIEERLRFIPWLVDSLEQIAREWDGSAICSLAQERAVHLAAEIITDIGSDLIDGFMMREASSYEDIVEVLHGEKVFPAHIFDTLLIVVKQRKPLVQEYFSLQRLELDPLVTRLSAAMPIFAEAVQTFIEKELRLES